MKVNRKYTLIFLFILMILGVVGVSYLGKIPWQEQSQDTQISSPFFTPSSLTEGTEETLRVTVIATGLEVPWGIAFLPTSAKATAGGPDGGILVTERAGRVRKITKDGILEEQPVAQIAAVRQIGEGGLHGIALHPSFEVNSYVYLYYTYGGQGGATLNRVSRFTYEENRLQDERIIVDAIPGASNHDGGRIKFGPDGYLYITTGDAQNPSLAQDRTALAGKILRVTDEGKPAPSNPFGTLVYSYGHRNPQGITWDEKNTLWETEHGSSAMDELNRIEPGKNYGWPTVRGDETREGLVAPVLHSGSDTWAPAGASYHSGSIYFAGLRGQALYQSVLSGNSASLQTHFKAEFGRLRDVVVGPDGMLYITTSNRDGRGNPRFDDDKILRINPEKL